MAGGDDSAGGCGSVDGGGSGSVLDGGGPSGDSEDGGSGDEGAFVWDRDGVPVGNANPPSGPEGVFAAADAKGGVSKAMGGTGKPFEPSGNVADTGATPK